MSIEDQTRRGSPQDQPAVPMLPTDPDFLLHADPDEVLSTLSGMSGSAARQAAMVYRTSLAHHRDANPQVRRHMLSVDTARWGDLGLARRIAALPIAGLSARWQVRWATRSALDGAVLWTAPHHANASSVAIAEVDGRPVVVTGYGPVRLFDLHSGEMIAAYEVAGGAGPIATANVDGRPVVVTSGPDGAIQVADLSGGTSLGAALIGHSGPVRAITTTVVDGRTVAVTASDDRTIRVWDLASRTPVGGPLAGHDRAVLAVAVGLLEGRAVVVSGSADRTVRAWDLASGTPVGEPISLTSRVATVAVADREGRPVVLTAGSRTPVEVWDLTTRRRVDQPLAGSVPGSHAIIVTQLDGRPVVVTGGPDRFVRFLDLATGERLCAEAPGHADGVWAVAAAELAGRPIVITSSSDRTLRAWDLTALRYVDWPPKGHTAGIGSVSVTTLRDRSIAISGGCADHTVGCDGAIRVWDLDDGGQVGEPLPGHDVGVAELAGRSVIVSDGNGLTVHDLADRTLRARHRGNADNLLTVGELDGRPVAVVEDYEYGAIVRDLVDGSVVAKPMGAARRGDPDDYVWAATITALKGRPVVVVVGGFGTAEVWVWWLSSGRSACRPRTGHKDSVYAVAATELAGRPVVVTGGYDHTVRVWDLATGSPVGDPLMGHTAAVKAVATMTVAGRPVAISGGPDHTVRVWDLESGEQRDVLRFPAPVGALAATPDGRLIVAFGPEIAVFSSFEFESEQIC